MDMRPGSLVVIALAVGLAVAALATWAACRWWYGRKLLAAAQRIYKSDQGRLFSQQQTLQAKQQIESLKRELDAQRQLLQDTQASRQRTKELEHALRMAEQAVARAAQADTDSGLMSLGPAHGFADTQIMP